MCASPEASASVNSSISHPGDKHETCTGVPICKDQLPSKPFLSIVAGAQACQQAHPPAQLLTTQQLNPFKLRPPRPGAPRRCCRIPTSPAAVSALMLSACPE